MNAGSRVALGALALHALALGALAGCVDPNLRFAQVDLLDWEAEPVEGPVGGTTLAATPDGATVFAGSWNRLFVHDVATEQTEYVEIPSDNVHFIDGHLFAAGAASTRVYVADGGGAALQEVGQSTFAALHIAVDGERAVISDGWEVWLVDRASLPQAGWVTEELRGWSTEDALWESSVRDVALRGDTLLVATDSGAWAFDLREEPPALLYTVGSWLTPSVRVEGDILIAGEGYDSTKLDFTDPARPRVVDRLYGGGRFDVRDGRYYSHDQNEVFVTELGAPGERATPLRSIPLVACHAVVGVVGGAYAVCDDQPMYRLGPPRE